MHYQKTGVSVLRTTAILWAQTVVRSHIEVATASTGFSLDRKEAGACAWLLLGLSSGRLGPPSAAGAAASSRTSSPDSSHGTSLASPSEEPVFEWGFDGSSTSEPDSSESEIICTSVSPVKPLPLPVKDLPLPLDGALALWTRLPTTMPAMWKSSLTVIHG